MSEKSGDPVKPTGVHSDTPIKCISRNMTILGIGIDSIKKPAIIFFLRLDVKQILPNQEISPTSERIVEILLMLVIQ